MNRITIYILLASILCSCTPNNIQIEINDSNYRNMTMHERYKGFFNIGTCLSAGEFGSNDIESLDNRIVNQYNVLVAENCMKPSLIRTKDELWNWEYSDRIVNYSNTMGHNIRGHVLIWHQMTPWWMTNGDKAKVRNNLVEHIETLVGKYKGDIYCWDVVNEAVSDSFGYRKDSPWYEAYGGPEYIIDAFKTASVADPECLLFYNDYNLTSPIKRRNVVNMINELNLIENGLDGIGMQAHWSLNYPSIKSIEKTINTFHKMGLMVEITELDISCYSPLFRNEKEKVYDKNLEKKLAKRYRDIFELFRKNSEKINTVTFWGTVDGNSWLNYHRSGVLYTERREDYPLLFDINQKPKQAYYEIMQF